MADPEMQSDEKILLTTQDVFVKSIPFEAVLTTKRIILIDRKKNLIPPKDILLATVRNVEASENAIRDQTIILTLVSGSGDTRQLVLTFSRTAGGGRKRERDEWYKSLKELTSTSIPQAFRKVIPSFDQEPRKRMPEPAPQKIGITSRPSAKKEIEGAHPIKKIVEAETYPLKPVETSSLPEGSFCSRCGNRVPPESVFCNRCGSRVIPPGQEEPAVEEPVVPISPQAAQVPQVVVDSPLPAAKVPAGERKERPVDREIQSIEPLIEGSVRRTTEAPPVPSKTPEQPAETPVSAAGEPSAIEKAALSIINAVTPAPAAPSAAAGAEGQMAVPAAAPADAPPAPGPHVTRTTELPAAPVSPTTTAPVPQPPERPGSGRRTMVAVAGIVLIIAIIAGAAFLLPGLLKGSGGDSGGGETIAPTPIPTPVKTPVPTTVTPSPTATATPVITQAAVPSQGIYVRVDYEGTYRGSIGTAGNQLPVYDTGTKVFVITTVKGIVEATIQKTDGSGRPLTVEVYQDGKLIKTSSTVVPKGTVEVQVDLRPPATTTVPTTKPTTVAVNTTTTAPTTNTTTQS